MKCLTLAIKCTPKPAKTKFCEIRITTTAQETKKKNRNARKTYAEIFEERKMKTDTTNFSQQWKSRVKNIIREYQLFGQCRNLCIRFYFFFCLKFEGVGVCMCVLWMSCRHIYHKIYAAAIYAFPPGFYFFFCRDMKQNDEKAKLTAPASAASCFLSGLKMCTTQNSLFVFN